MVVKSKNPNSFGVMREKTIAGIFIREKSNGHPEKKKQKMRWMRVLFDWFTTYFFHVGNYFGAGKKNICNINRSHEMSASEKNETRRKSSGILTTKFDILRKRNSGGFCACSRNVMNMCRAPADRLLFFTKGPVKIHIYRTLVTLKNVRIR